MTVKIENMQPNPGDGVATFDATFPDGWTIRKCVVIRRPNGDLAAVPPLVRNGIRAVTIPDKHWRPFIVAALDAYAELDGEAEDAGLRRVLAADMEDALRQVGA